MNKHTEDASTMLEEQQQELERIRRRRGNHGEHEQLRKVLNILFMALALIGVVLYFRMPDNHLYGMGVIAAGMVIKMVEFFVRFML